MKDEKKPLSIKMKVVFGFAIIAVLLGSIIFLSLQTNGEISATTHAVEGEQKQNTSITNWIIALVVILVFYVIGFGFYFSKRIFKPIQDLTFATEQLQKKNFAARVDVKSKDELGKLSGSFNNALATLEEMEEERKRLEKAKTEFLSITSHELRTELTPLKTQVVMLLKEYFGKLNPKQRKSLNVVLESTEQLGKIIEDIIDLSRLQTAKMRFNFKKTDLSKKIKYVIEEMKAFMPEKKIEIKSNIQKLPEVQADSDRICQAIRNLINNAIKFTPPRGKVEVSARLEKENLLFTVKDNGQGIKEEATKRIFEPFFKGEPIYKSQEGSGLGLAIVKGIIEAHRGKVWFESKLGKGSTFYFTIPIKNKV